MIQSVLSATHDISVGLLLRGCGSSGGCNSSNIGGRLVAFVAGAFTSIVIVGIIEL